MFQGRKQWRVIARGRVRLRNWFLFVDGRCWSCRVSRAGYVVEVLHRSRSGGRNFSLKQKWGNIRDEEEEISSFFYLNTFVCTADARLKGLERIGVFHGAQLGSEAAKEGRSLLSRGLDDGFSFVIATERWNWQLNCCSVQTFILLVERFMQRD